MDKLFKDRNDMVRHVCNSQMVRSRLFQKFSNKSFINREKEVMLCKVPKIASTSFRKVFLALAGMSDVMEMRDDSIYTPKFQSKLTFVKDLHSSQEFHRFKKFMFVRNPLKRLLSAYKDKIFAIHPGGRDKVYHQINRLYDEYPGLNRSKINHFSHENGPLTFEEYLYFVTDWYNSDSQIYSVHEHFLDIHSLCKVCDVKYDFIGKMETLSEEVQYIFNRLDINITFPTYKARNKVQKKPTSELVEDSYRPLPLDLRRKVFNIVKIDALLFEYEIPDWFII